MANLKPPIDWGVRYVTLLVRNFLEWKHVMFLDVPWIKRIDQKSPFRRIRQTIVFFSIKSSLRQTRVLTRGFIRPTRFIIATLFFSHRHDYCGMLSSMQSCGHAGKRKQHLDKILFTCDCFSFWWKHQVYLTVFLKCPKGFSHNHTSSSSARNLTTN